MTKTGRISVMTSSFPFYALRFEKLVLNKPIIPNGPNENFALLANRIIKLIPTSAVSKWLLCTKL